MNRPRQVAGPLGSVKEYQPAVFSSRATMGSEAARAPSNGLLEASLQEQLRRANISAQQRLTCLAHGYRHPKHASTSALCDLYRGSIGCAFKSNPQTTAHRHALLLINVSVCETSRPVLFQTPCLWTDSSQPDPGIHSAAHTSPRASRGMVG
jgi:hypothetical protein